MILSNNLLRFMIKQATSEKDLAQIAEKLAKAKAEEKKREEVPIDRILREMNGTRYGKRFLRGAAVGLPLGAILGGVRGYQADQALPLLRRNSERTFGGALGGALGGATVVGLSNMLAAYLQGDLYDAIAASK